MEKREELKRMYSNILKLIDPIGIRLSVEMEFPEIIVTRTDSKIQKIVSGRIPKLKEIDEFISEYIHEIEIYIDEYLNRIENDHLKWIAINRLQADFKLYLNSPMKFDRSRVLRNVKVGPFESLAKSLNHVCETLFYEVTPNIISDIEFDLIGATPRKRKEKQELSLSQVQINLLFHSLIKTDVVINISKDVAEGLSKMTGLGVNLFKQDLNNPFREGNDTHRIPKDADFVKVIKSLQKSIDYLKKIKIKNEII
jgi:hypothetical protein